MKTEEKNELIEYGIRAIATIIATLILFIYFFVSGLEVHAQINEYEGTACTYYGETNFYKSGSYDMTREYYLSDVQSESYKAIIFALKMQDGGYQMGIVSNGAEENYLSVIENTTYNSTNSVVTSSSEQYMHEYVLDNGKTVYASYIGSGWYANSTTFDVFEHSDSYPHINNSEYMLNFLNAWVNGSVNKLQSATYTHGGYSLANLFSSANGSIDLEKDGVYDSTLDIPRLSVDSIGYDFGFNNGTNELYYEMKGRWYSVDDIELYKENLMWKYKYSTLLKGELSTWVSADDMVTANQSYNFKELGQNAFNNFLSAYPVEERNYYGGTNSLGNFFSGYNDALDTIHLLLNEPTSAYNGVEVYVRYFYYDNDGVIHYSKWTHWYDALADAGGSSGSTWDDKDNLFTENQSENGLTTDEFTNLEDSGNTRNDIDAQPTYNNSTNYVDSSENLLQAFQNFFNMISGLIDMMGSFPSMVAEVFGFLPNWVISLIGLGIGAVILLRFIGR